MGAKMFLCNLIFIRFLFLSFKCKGIGDDLHLFDWGEFLFGVYCCEGANIDETEFYQTGKTCLKWCAKNNNADISNCWLIVDYSKTFRFKLRLKIYFAWKIYDTSSECFFLSIVQTCSLCVI